MFKQTVTATRRRSSSQGSEELLLPHVGHEQNQNQDEQSSPQENKNKTSSTQQNNIPKLHITVPYYKGLSESVKKRCSNYGVQVYFKGGTTIKNLLMTPKDIDPMMKKSGVIYSYKCGRVECDEEYIGESSRTFGERFKEHQKAPSSIFDHFNTTGHSISVENFNIVGREEQNLKRAIKEALYIRVNNPSLNRKCWQIPSDTYMG